MKTIFLAIIFVSLTSALISQTTELDDGIMSSANDIYSLNYLGGVNNGRGNAGIGTTQDVSGVLMNPAGLDIRMKQQVSFQYTYKTTQNWVVNSEFGNYDYNTEHILPSLFIAYGLKLNKFITAGISYSNPASAKYDFNNFPFAAIDEDFYYEYNVHSFNLPFSYNAGKFRAGISLNYSFYRTFLHGVTTIIEPETSHDAVTSFWRLNAQFGILFIPSDMFSAGVTFTPGFKAYPQSDIEPVSTNIKVVSKFPMKLGTGIKVTAVRNKLNLFLDYNFTQSSELKGYKDRHDFNIGTEYIVNKNTVLRAGGFTFLDNRNFSDSTVEFSHPDGEFEQIFVTFGGTVKVNNVEFNASIMDSHLSKGFIKNTYLNAGAVVNF